MLFLVNHIHQQQFILGGAGGARRYANAKRHIGVSCLGVVLMPMQATMRAMIQMSALRLVYS